MAVTPANRGKGRGALTQIAASKKNVLPNPMNGPARVANLSKCLHNLLRRLTDAEAPLCGFISSPASGAPFQLASFVAPRGPS